MKRIGLFGGSFDPVTIGHTAIMKAAIKQLKLDTLLIIPTLHNPWKESEGASAKDRIKMLKLATKSMKRVIIDKIEINSNQEKNYTVDTIREIKQRYPKDKLYYIMGMDQASSFHLWKDAFTISDNVQLCVFDRSGYKKNDNLKTFHFKKLNIDPIEVSSTDVRAGKIEYLNKDVLRYIVSNGLYLETMIQSKMSKKRYLHSVSVAKTAQEIARSNNLDPLKAYIAGMFHDIAKEMDPKKAKKLMKKHYPKYINKPYAIWHQWLSAYVCKHEYRLRDKEILQAITHHTTASTNMSKLDMCIYIADKYEPLRGFDSSKELALAKQDIELGFKESLNGFYEFSKKKHRDIDPVFFKIYKKYVKESSNE